VIINMDYYRFHVRGVKKNLEMLDKKLIKLTKEVKILTDRDDYQTKKIEELLTINDFLRKPINLQEVSNE